jgi:hypothetical protein
MSRTSVGTAVILSLAPHVDTRLVLVAKAFAGIEVTVCARIDDWKRTRR